MSISEDALVAVCVCTQLGRGTRIPALSVREWTDLVVSLHRDRGVTPREILGRNAAQLVAEFGIQGNLAARLEELLLGLASVGMELERLDSAGIWTLTRGDEDYPRIWKRKLGSLAPPVLFGAGPRAALAADLVAIVGSRNVDEAGSRFACELAELCARDGWGIVSGGVRGVDQIAMEATLSAGGFGVEILPDSIERAIARKVKRDAILDERLTVLTSSSPSALSTGASCPFTSRRLRIA